MQVVHTIQIVSEARGGFRAGEWADLVGVALVTPEGMEPRLCYFVIFPDGKSDYWPVSERHSMRPASAK